MKFPNFQRPRPKFPRFQVWKKVPHHCLFFLKIICTSCTVQWNSTRDYPSFKTIKIWSVEELETLTAGTKPRTPHTIDRLEEKGMEKGSTQWSSLKVWEKVIINLTNTGKNKGNFRETSERQGRVHNYGLFQAHQYHLELNWSKTTFPHAFLSILILWKWYEPLTKDWWQLSTDFHCDLSSGFLLCCCIHFYLKVLHRYWLSQTSNLCLLKHFDISVVLQTFFTQTSPHCPIMCVLKLSLLTIYCQHTYSHILCQLPTLNILLRLSQTSSLCLLKTFGHQFGFADFPYTNINTLFHNVYT